ncbi:MAG TPA: hypothetical protein VGF14_05055 [Alphaproteobacteria bacterium]
MSLLHPVILRRLGFWALLQALPSESALKIYLKSVFLALCSAVIGSILLGALIASGMIVLYQSLISNGIEPWMAGFGTAGAGVIILALFVLTFLRAIRQIVVVQDSTETAVREKARTTPVGRIVDALRDGFSSGYRSSL